MRNTVLNIRNPSHINTKCFQFNWVSWSKRYLGMVPLAAMANTVKNTAFKIKIKKGIHATVRWGDKLWLLRVTFIL